MSDSMLRKVRVADIVPSPFQIRQQMNPETIKELASEIEKVGLWTGALRGREVGGKVELCFGHRRLEAIKTLKWKEVDIEIAKLSDQDMIVQGLIENLQREGLKDIERGDGIALLKNQIEKTGEPVTNAKLGKLIGLSAESVREYLQMADLKGADRKAVESGKVTAWTVLEAKEAGDPEIIAAAVKNGLTPKQVRKLVKKAKSKKLKDKRKKAAKRGEPPDLLLVITQWRDFIEGWTKQLEEVVPYIDYIDRAETVAGSFRSAVRKLMASLNKFL